MAALQGLNIMWFFKVRSDNRAGQGLAEAAARPAPQISRNILLSVGVLKKKTKDGGGKAS